MISQFAAIAAFFFDPNYAKEFGYKLDEFFKKRWEPKLLNEFEVSDEKTIGQKVYESVANIGKSPKKVQKEKAAAAVLAEKQQLTFNLSRANFDNLLRENFEKLQRENDYHEAHRACKWLYLSTNKKTGEMSTAQVPKAEVPKAQVPKQKAPILQVPKAQVPKAHVLMLQVPKAQMSLSQGPKAQVPKAQVAMLQVPKGQMSLPQVRKPQVPMLQAPKAQVNDGTATISLSDDNFFLAFVIDSANFENHRIEMKCPNLLTRVGLLSKRNGKGKYDIGEIVRYLTLQYKAYLGVVYLLKKKWNCEKMDDYLMYGECKKFKEYLLVLYEFLFTKYIEANCPWLAHQLATTVRPIFVLGNSQTNATIIDVLDNLCIIWAFFFDYDYGQKYENNLAMFFNQKAAAEPKWLNEETIGHKIVKNLQQITKFGAEQLLLNKDSAATKLKKLLPNNNGQKWDEQTESDANIFKQIYGRVKSNENDDELKQSLNDHSSMANSDEEIQSCREAFDGIIKSMAETAKSMDESAEGFSKNKKLLRFLFL
ncbi:hypothetical protein niasHT_015084 [Heterodera trifolii]|uniref:Uncharacterized protein n=1 Tax=Heterodera trifolii TaxID=157864 RepID=A0ABD2L9J8_9BILA